MSVYEVTVSLASGAITVSVTAQESITQTELLNLAISEIEKQLECAKLDSYYKYKL